MPTLWITRFMDALEVLCGTRPPTLVERADPSMGQGVGRQPQERERP